MERGVGLIRYYRLVRHHQHCFSVLLDQATDEFHNFIRAFAVQVAGGLVTEQESGIGDDGASDGYALLLPAGELSRIVMHAVREPDDAEHRFDMLAPFR